MNHLNETQTYSEVEHRGIRIGFIPPLETARQLRHADLATVVAEHIAYQLDIPDMVVHIEYLFNDALPVTVLTDENAKSIDPRSEPHVRRLLNKWLPDRTIITTYDTADKDVFAA